jgi:hypothetical protein
LRLHGNIEKKKSSKSGTANGSAGANNHAPHAQLCRYGEGVVRLPERWCGAGASTVARAFSVHRSAGIP